MIINRKKQGIIGTLALILIGIGLLGYFRVDVRSVLERPEIKKSAVFVVDNGKVIWDKYVRDEVSGIAGYISDHHVIEKTVALSLEAWKKLKSAGEGLSKI